MSAGAPWSVKGIDPKTREIAKDLARRSGMTLGEWLNHMITEGGEDDTVTPLGRRAADYRGPERRHRARRLDDAYHDDDPDELSRVTRALEVLSERIETAERRSTLAVSGIDQAVAGLLSRLEGAEKEQASQARRLEDFAEDRREDLDRLRRIEREVSGPRSVEALRALEGALGKVATQILETEARTRQQLSEVQGGLTATERRLERVEARPDPAQLVEQVVAKIADRLERAEAQTSGAMRQLETSFASLDERLRGTESRLDSQRLDKLAHDLSQKVADARIELIQRFDHVTGGRFDKVERALADLAGHVQTAENRSAQAIEKMGQEVLRIAQNLNGRVNEVERTGAATAEKLGSDMSRFAEAIETRLRKADHTHAQMLERLGGEIARISEKLGERIIQAERRSTLNAEDFSERVGRMADKLEARYERANGELADRIRQSEERTAKLLEEARATLDRIHGARRPEEPEPVPAPVAVSAPVAPARPAEPEEPPFPGAFGRSAFGGGDDYAEPAPTFGHAEPGAEAGFFADAEPGFPAPPAPTPSPSGFDYDAPDAAFRDYDPPAAPVIPPFTAPEPAPLPEARDVPAFDAFEADDEFVSPDQLKAGAFAASAGRPAVSTKEAIEAARAAARLGPRANAEDTKGQGFALAGLKLGAKQRLAERLAKEKKRETSTVKKALLASAVAATAATVLGGYITIMQDETAGPGEGGRLKIEQAAPIAAVAVSPTGALPGGAEADTAYQAAVKKLDAGAPDAVESLTAAANLGSPAAQFHLAKLYENGELGLSRDLGAARRWTERAALGGERRAMHNLGLYYFDAIGVDKNPTKAAEWFRKAAEAGLVDSQYNLGRLYEQGIGVEQDLGEAYKWYLIASASGDEEARASADALKASLPAGVRREAERAAARFQAAEAVAAATAESAARDVASTGR